MTNVVALHETAPRLDYTPLINLDAERDLIGAVLSDGSSIGLVDTLKAEDFADLAHQRIWTAILGEHHAGRRPTVATVMARLRDEGGSDGGGFGKYLAAVRAAGMPMEAPEYAAHLHDLALKRRILTLIEEAPGYLADAERPAEETIARFSADLHRIAKDGTASALSKRAVAEAVVNLAAKPPPCYATGLADLDEAIGGGLYAGRLYGIAARKKVGKTVLLGTISHNLNARGVRHLFIAMEMTPAEIEQRNMARELEINSIAFLKQHAPLDRIANYAISVRDATFYEAAAGASLEDVRRMIARAVVQHEVSGVVLDYWQLVGGKRPNETEEYHLRQVAQGIADTCRRQGLWALIAAQVNQDGNTRGGEGLKLACDLYFTLHREKHEAGAWLEMEESRYCPYQDVGAKDRPGLMLNKNGPYFAEIGTTPEMF